MSDTMQYEIMPETDSVSFPTDDAPYRCEACGIPIEYGGRGRKPRFCAEHKKGAAKSSGTTAPSLKAVEESLQQLYGMVGIGLMPFNPVDAITVMNASDQLAHSWIVAAEANPKLKKALIKMTASVGIGAVIIAHAPVVVALLQNHKVIPGG